MIRRITRRQSDVSKARAIHGRDDSVAVSVDGIEF